jgi:hypothetical protein
VTRTFGVVAGATLVAAAIATLIFGLRDATSQLPARGDQAQPAPAPEPRTASSVRLSSSAAVQRDATPSVNLESVTPAGIVETLETSRDTRAIQAALSAVLTTYSSRSTRKPLPGAELEHALLRHVRSDSGVITRAALAAARVPLMTEAPGAELVSAIAEAAGPTQAPARRTLALETLNLIRPDRRGAEVLSVMEQALSAPQPEVVSQALFGLASSGPSLVTLSQANRAELAKRVSELVGHANPGIRGRALFVLAQIGDLVAADVRLATALQTLHDREPYVRAEAANLAGRCRAPRAIHALMAHVGDLAAARYDLRFLDIEGRSSTAEHHLPGRPRVAEAALFSILALSRELPVPRQLELTLGGGVQAEARVLENAAGVRSWYAEVGARIPR